MAAGDKIKWEDADFKWELAPTKVTAGRYTWNDIAVLQEAIGGGGDMEEMPWMKWGDEDERKKKLIKLILKVKGKTYREEKETQNYKITVKDIKLAVKEVLGAEIIAENVSL